MQTSIHRILIAERNEGWGFWSDKGIVIAKTPFLAAVAARIYGETLKESDAGYEVVLDTGNELIELHTRQFGAEDALASGSRSWRKSPSSTKVAIAFAL